AAFPGEIAVASVDHGLRAEAADEVAMVGEVCAALDVPYAALKVQLSRGNVQARARQARYQALGEWAQASGLGALATAHHADDQAETLLMRLARGSGLAGLAGVRASSHVPGFDDLLLIRPLLSWRKSELEQIVAAAGIKPASDPSNKDLSFDRVRIREHLSEHEWLAPENLAQSASNLGEAWLALQWFAEIDWEDMVHKEPAAITYYANVPRAVAVETITRIIAELGGVVTRAEAGRAFDRLWQGENASLGGVLAVPGVEKVAKVGVEMRSWRFALEPPRNVH
ncbi:MAG: tRNA lysidine(34) synthetase TilS, partial [Pseudomonadota bacterium]